MASDNNLQKPNIYNRFSPFSEFINKHGCILFDEIRENLSRTIQLDELNLDLQYGPINYNNFLYIMNFILLKMIILNLLIIIYLFFLLLI